MRGNDLTLLFNCLFERFSIQGGWRYLGLTKTLSMLLDADVFLEHFPFTNWDFLIFLALSFDLIMFISSIERIFDVIFITSKRRYH